MACHFCSQESCNSPHSARNIANTAHQAPFTSINPAKDRPVGSIYSISSTKVLFSLTPWQCCERRFVSSVHLWSLIACTSCHFIPSGTCAECWCRGLFETLCLLWQCDRQSGPRRTCTASVARLCDTLCLQMRLAGWMAAGKRASKDESGRY